MPNEITPPKFQTPMVGIQNLSVFRFPVEPEPSDRPLDKKSLLGTPIYASLIFKALSGKDLNNLSEPVKKIVSEDFEMTQVLMVCNQSKNIVRTALNGRNGTVKEYISDGDYSITVDGLVVGAYPLVYPSESIKALKTFLELSQSIEVAGQFLSLYGITNVVINDFSFHELEGFRNQVAFRILMWSDTDFKIEPTDVTTQ